MAEIAWFRDNAFRLPETRRRAPPVRAMHRPPTGASCVRHHRTIFISDVHLGTKGCKAAMLTNFLDCNSCDTLYLVGDIVDGWRLKHRWYWPQEHNRVLDALLRKIDAGTRIIFIPGNHDEVFRGYCGRAVAGIDIMREAVHETADGRKLLVVHGDQFDAVIVCAKWLALLGDWAYGLALELNELCHGLRRRLGLDYWSLAAFLKQKVKNAVEYIGRFESALADEVRARGLDGVVCGHIHHAAARHVGNVLYFNDGDWVESCTALVEDRRGKLEILHWAAQSERRRDLPVAAPDDIATIAPA